MAAAVAQALPEFFVMDELGDRASEAIAHVTGAQAGAVVHCTAAGITLAVAATMTGGDPRRIATLPDATDMHHRVVMPACHVVDYGHSNLQGIRLAGAQVDLAGDDNRCGVEDLEEELDGPDVSLPVPGFVPADARRAARPRRRRTSRASSRRPGDHRRRRAVPADRGPAGDRRGPRTGQRAEVPRLPHRRAGRRHLAAGPGGARAGEGHRPGDEADQGGHHRRHRGARGVAGLRPDEVGSRRTRQGTRVRRGGRARSPRSRPRWSGIRPACRCRAYC